MYLIALGVKRTKSFVTNMGYKIFPCEIGKKQETVQAQCVSRIYRLLQGQKREIKPDYNFGTEFLRNI
jgi:hypothetical protein